MAALAGASTATVSNALNGTGRLSEATRQRVIAAVREFGYAPTGTGVLGLAAHERGIPMMSDGRPPDPRWDDAWVDPDHDAAVRLLLRPDRVGDEAVDLLIALVNGRAGVNRRRVVQPVLLPRRSTSTEEGP
ncbi:LacI family DNA-binding transcriptional regulator [Lentzea flava]|uniref:LacI family DNA-binding transcriptional regulator n=1 Tax=Lentzea flava TaxID=103732 RepID=UPI001E5EACF5|nr:LacI family DNA-binding transcriptional regulator [Lentzea flava]